MERIREGFVVIRDEDVKHTHTFPVICDIPFCKPLHNSTFMSEYDTHARTKTLMGGGGIALPILNLSVRGGGWSVPCLNGYTLSKKKQW